MHDHVDHVFPDVPIRQGVLSLPYPLRYQLAWDHDLCRGENAQVGPLIRPCPGSRIESRHHTMREALIYGVTRQAQDEYSLISQQRVARAQPDGFFAGELTPMDVTRAILDKKTQKTGLSVEQIDLWELNEACPSRPASGPALADLL